MNKYFITKGEKKTMPNNMMNNYNWSSQPMMSYSSNPYNYINRQYQSQYNTTPQQQQFYSNNSQNNIIWVKGKENARSMQLQPNSTVILLDSEVGKFYIKTTDDIGLGRLRVFSYVEEPDVDQSEKITTPNLDLSNYVTKTQLEQAIKEMKNSEQSISTVESKPTNAKQKYSIVNKQF